MKNIFNKAINEIRDNGNLSLKTRKKIWTTLGDRELNLSLKGGTFKRATLAMETMKKIIDEWDKEYPQDKRPHRSVIMGWKCQPITEGYRTEKESTCGKDILCRSVSDMS